MEVLLVLLPLVAFGFFDWNAGATGDDQDISETDDHTGPDGNPLFDPAEINAPETTTSQVFTEPSVVVEDFDLTLGVDYTLSTGFNRLASGDGDDIVRTVEDSRNSITMGDGDDLFLSGGGTNDVNGGAGADSYVGSDGDDRFVDTDGASLMFGGSGLNSYTAIEGSTIVGGDGVDRISLHLDVTQDAPVIIDQFDPDHDNFHRIVLTGVENAAELNVVDWSDGTGADLRYGDTVLAHIHGGKGLALDIQPAQESEFDEERTNLVIHVGDGATFNGSDAGEFIQSGWANDHAVTVNGGGGGDYISGFASQDPSPSEFYGDEGDDILWVRGASEPGGSGGNTGHPFQEAPLVHGGDGDDILVSYDETILTGGAGADTFGIARDDTPNVHDSPQITDFNPSEDTLVIDGDYQALGPITVSPWTDGTGADILAGTQVLAQVTGGQNLNPADIRVATQRLEVEPLGHH